MSPQIFSTLMLLAVIIGIIFIVRKFGGKRKFKDLTPEDFPGVDPNKFTEWKQSVLDADRTGAWVIIGIVILMAFTSPYIGGIGELILLFIVLPIALYMNWSRPNRLAKQLGIDKAAIRRARKKLP